jgi:hypothetical protein
MAHSFKSSSGYKAFGVFSEPQDAGDYIYNKKARATYCIPNSCKPSIKVGSESNYLLYKRATKLAIYPCTNTINKANLNINLITNLDLANFIVFTPNTIPQPAVPPVPPYNTYNIDPSGNLFGNTICGINNYVNYMRYNLPKNPNAPPSWAQYFIL